jgi:hypothetical protein
MDDKDAGAVADDCKDAGGRIASGTAIEKSEGAGISFAL